MSLRRQVEEAFLAQWAHNERVLAAARKGILDPVIVERYEAYQDVLAPIVAEIAYERDAERN